MKADLGLNPSTSGDLIRVTMPVLTEETRQEYIKQARTEAENSRISIRNTRRDANNSAKDQQKAGDISEDDLKRTEDLVQKETNHFIGLVEAELKKKEEDLIEIQILFPAAKMAKHKTKSFNLSGANVAIIMDGNGRWAKKNTLNVTSGHEKGVDVVRRIVESAAQNKIASLSLYAFSTENWSRPKKEILGIKKLIISAINSQVPDLINQKVSLNFFGDYQGLSLIHI